ncbi:MAG TPA: hypothetical protein VF601_12975 [Beijerinckiaceae bacterium]|jgi:hypothetical protein
MIRGQAGAAARDSGAAHHRHAGPAPDLGEILQRFAALAGDIDSLRRERLTASIFEARAKLAAVYFRKRHQPAQPRMKEAA